MMGTQAAPERLFYDFCLEDHVPDDHLLRRIDLSLPKIPSAGIRMRFSVHTTRPRKRKRRLRRAAVSRRHAIQ